MTIYEIYPKHVSRSCVLGFDRTVRSEVFVVASPEEAEKAVQEEGAEEEAAGAEHSRKVDDVHRCS